MKPFELHLKNLEWSAPTFALGTHKFGGNGATDADYSLSDARCFELMDIYAENGGNVIDTAALYGKCAHPKTAHGYSEICIGDWMQSRGCRKQILLMTKGAHHTHKDGIKIHRVTQKDIAEDLEQSLENLKTDYIDVYFLHRDDPRIPAGEILEWLDPYVKSGVIRVLGGSNWTVARMEEANAYARAHGLAEFETSEIGFSLRKESLEWNDGSAVEMDAAEYAGYLRTGMPVFAYNAQSGGFFYQYFNTPDAEIPAGPTENLVRLNRVRALCRQTGMTPQEVLFGYLNGQRVQTLPIAATESPQRLKQMLVGAQAVLTQEQIEFLLGENWG